MGANDPKRGTRINARDGRNLNPLRGVTKKEARRVLKQESEGKPTAKNASTKARKAAADHYASELRNDSAKKPWWR